MAAMWMHANRVLRQRVLSDGVSRGLVGYFSLRHGERPLWWDARRFEPDAIGAFENVVGSDVDAIVVGSGGLTVVGETLTRLPYKAMHELVPPRKDPLPQNLEFRSSRGSLERIPIYRAPGCVFVMYQFLLAAVRESRP